MTRFILQLVERVDPQQVAKEAEDETKRRLLVEAKKALEKAGWCVQGLTPEQYTSAVRKAAQDLRDSKVVPEGMWITIPDVHMPGHR